MIFFPRFISKRLRAALFISLALFPFGAYAKTPALLEISGWIPYWRAATGTADVLEHIDYFKEINPFGYTVKNDGTLFDALKIDEEPWTTLIAEAKRRKIRVVPSVMWSNTEAIHRVLSKQKTRIALEDRIAALVKEKEFDGIDIDFEGKKAETKNYFSIFLKGLYRRMGKKWVMCSIEARTPLDSRYDVIPKHIRYANDFSAINRYCDRVRLMTYDQGTVDLRLNDAAPGPYIPVADSKWVEKVVKLAAKNISKKKLVIGVATYGYEYKAVKLTEDGYRYNLLWAFNPKYALDLAAQTGATPERNLAGELSFIYSPSASSSFSQSDAILSNNANIATTSFSSATGQAAANSVSAPFNIVWWSDAAAIKDKINLARKLGVRGVAIFKIDGGEDPAIWDILKK